MLVPSGYVAVVASAGVDSPENVSAPRRPAQDLAAAMVARLAGEVINLDTEITATETMIEERSRRHRHAEIILSMPGFGVILGAEFLAAIGADMSASTPPIASPASADSRRRSVTARFRRISGNLKRPRRYHRRLVRTCYLAAQSAARTDPASRAYYDRKRAEGKHLGFPPNRGGFLYAAPGWMAAIFSYSTGGSKPAELCRRRRL